MFKLIFKMNFNWKLYSFDSIICVKLNRIYCPPRVKWNPFMIFILCSHLNVLSDFFELMSTFFIFSKFYDQHEVFKLFVTNKHCKNCFKLNFSCFESMVMYSLINIITNNTLLEFYFLIVACLTLALTLVRLQKDTTLF